MWVIVVAVIGGLLLLGILILAIPFNLAWKLEVSEKNTIDLRWSWLFGLINREIKIGRRVPRKKPSGKKKARSRFDLKNMVRRLRMAPDYLRIQGLFKQLVRLIKRVWRCLKIEKLEADLIFGLDDPSETFYLFALAEPVNRLLHHFQPYPVSLRPSFVETTLEIYTVGRLKVYPVQLIPPLLAFIFSWPVLRLIRKLISDRWRRGK